MKKLWLFAMIIALVGVLVACKDDEQQGEDLNAKIESVMEQIQLPERITGTSITLNTKVSDVDIKWVSDKPEVISNSGVVVIPFGEDVTVKLTATFTYKGETKTKNYTVIVVANKDVDQVAVKFTGLEYKFEQEEVKKDGKLMELNAKIIIKGKAYLFEGNETRTVKLVMYWKDGDVLAEYDNISTATDGTFEFHAYPSKYSIAGDWYKFKLEFTEGEHVRPNVLLPYKGEQKVLAVRQGKDGEIKYFQSVSNADMFNINYSDALTSEKTERMMVLADYGRTLISSNELTTGMTLMSSTGQWGSGSTIAWSIDEEYATISEDLKVTVLKNTAIDETIDLVATITKGEETVEKVFKVTTNAKALVFSGATVTFETRKDGDNTYVDIRVKGTIDNPGGNVFTLQMEALYGNENGALNSDQYTRMSLFENLSTDPTKFEFLINISELNRGENAGEWGKIRLLITENEVTRFMNFETGKDTLPEGKAVYTIDGNSAGFKIGNQWNFIYFEPTGAYESKEVVTTTTVKLVQENDKIFLVIEGVIADFIQYQNITNIELVIKDMAAVGENLTESTAVGAYQFKFDVTAANSNWADIQVKVTYADGQVAFRDFEASSAMVGTLNAAYQIDAGDGSSYKFAEWGNSLKVTKS